MHPTNSKYQGPSSPPSHPPGAPSQSYPHLTSAPPFHHPGFRPPPFHSSSHPNPPYFPPPPLPPPPPSLLNPSSHHRYVIPPPPSSLPHSVPFRTHPSSYPPHAALPPSSIPPVPTPTSFLPPLHLRPPSTSSSSYPSFRPPVFPPSMTFPPPSSSSSSSFPAPSPMYPPVPPSSSSLPTPSPSSFSSSSLTTPPTIPPTSSSTSKFIPFNPSLSNTTTNTSSSSPSLQASTPNLTASKPITPSPMTSFPPPKITVQGFSAETLSKLSKVFIGNISAGIGDEWMERILNACGELNEWKRARSSDGSPKGFGFATFQSPEAVLLLLKVIGEDPASSLELPSMDRSTWKRLLVKVDENSRKLLEDYKSARGHHKGDFEREKAVKLVVQDIIKGLRLIAPIPPSSSSSSTQPASSSSSTTTSTEPSSPISAPVSIPSLNSDTAPSLISTSTHSAITSAESDLSCSLSVPILSTAPSTTTTTTTTSPIKNVTPMPTTTTTPLTTTTETSNSLKPKRVLRWDQPTKLSNDLSSSSSSSTLPITTRTTDSSTSLPLTSQPSKLISTFQSTSFSDTSKKSSSSKFTLHSSKKKLNLPKKRFGSSSDSDPDDLAEDHDKLDLFGTQKNIGKEEEHGTKSSSTKSTALLSRNKNISLVDTSDKGQSLLQGPTKKKPRLLKPLPQVPNDLDAILNYPITWSNLTDTSTESIQSTVLRFVDLFLGQSEDDLSEFIIDSILLHCSSVELMECVQTIFQEDTKLFIGAIWKEVIRTTL